ncbi:MAG: zinc ribbon domain-containing protein [Psychrobium sp.]|nr:zinc ribbon domain-containing protein [Psychrobium sp.]
MAIITCPFCRQQISDKSKVCSHCDKDLNGDQQAALSAQRQSKYGKIQSINIQQMFAMLLFVGGFSLWYWQDKFDDQWYNQLGMAMIASGFVWYFVNRIRIVMLNRSSL